MISHAVFLVLLAPVLPLVGALWNVAAAAGFATAGWLLFGFVWIAGVPDDLRPFLIGETSVLAASTGLALALAVRMRREARGEDAASHDDVRELERRRKELKDRVSRDERAEARTLQIYATARGLAGAVSWNDMAPRLTAAVQKIFDAYEFLVFSIDDGGTLAPLLRRGGWSSEQPFEGSVPSRPLLLRPGETSEVVPVLLVPIYAGDGDQRRLNGLLALKTAGKEFDEDELIDTAAEVGEQLGMALDKAVLFARLERQSRIDGLTGVLRRQPFMDRLTEEFKRAEVFHTPFSVLMIDIDRFKAVNDAHGHPAGDAVLRRIGEILRESVYETDVVGRYGGEEFIVLMPRAQRDGAMRKADQIRRNIEATVIASGFEQLRATVSIGAAHYPVSADSGETLIARADEALYKAKEGGRNRVVDASNREG